MNDSIECQDCKQEGHNRYECRDPEVLANRRSYWPRRKSDADSFDDDADYLKWEKDNISPFD